ncbi:MFS transporter [Synechococcus sp. HJ21-Hayes]|jgi:predicted MFS family arabinose efflux permease|uniref:MFS transporter n=1 Tax=unclassified Synechococcus TaxID=2626047 RepID=UPI0020CE6091|nr:MULTISPECIES: MFS transporter [unclassified Synechococcus]MCP9830428.1 MFS transporter [Synechococcus sp. JJ3a-Johnson]MCP9852381.1 MFS transporter [Synechococcus sp. HJ21-Hayes]
MNRHALLTLCLVVAVDAACFGLLLPVLPFLVGDLTGSFNAISITQVTAVYAGCQLVGAPLIGRWSDRLGRKPLMAASVGIGSLALLGSALAPSLGLLMLFQGIKGASAGVFALAQAVVADSVEDADQRTVSYGALGASLGLGFVAGPAVGGLLGAVNPRAPFFAAAAFTLVNLVQILLVLQETRNSTHHLESEADPLRFWSHERGHLRRLLSVYFLFYLGFSAFTGIFVVDARDRFGWGPQAAGWVLCYVGVIAAAVQGGLIPRLLKRFQAGRLAGVGLILVAIAILGVAAIRSGNELYLTQLLFATGVGLSTPGLRSLLSLTVSANQQGILGGLTQSCISLTELLGPLMAGRLYTYSGYATAYQVQAALVLLAAGLLISARIRTQAVNTPSP